MGKVKFQITTELVILVLILGLAAFFRLYNIQGYMTFLGDEGRDAIVVSRLLLYADPILVGPGTSIGNMYLGPLYYYFMAPWLWLFGYNPVGPAVGIAFLGIATVMLVYTVAREWWGKTAALVSSLLYAIAPVVIIYSHSSWNPNIMPFFALLTVYSIWKAWISRNYKWFLLTGVAFGVVLQSHYLGLLLLPVIAIFWLLGLFYERKRNPIYYIRYTIYAGVLFALLMSPLVIFDARHGWRNFEAIKLFFTERQTTVSIRPWTSFSKLIPLGQQIMTELVSAKNAVVGNLVLAVLLAPLFWLIKAKKKTVSTKSQSAFLLCLIWIFSALVGFGLYKQHIYAHYYGFIFAAPFLLIGGISQQLVDKWPIRGKSLVIVGVLILIALNLLDNPLRYSPNNQLGRTIDVAAAIQNYSNDKPFNLAVIAERNYDAAYKYFLLKDNTKVVDIDPQKTDETITDQLFVVCEMPEEKCDPTHNPKAEVANFGWSKIENQWNINGVIVYKLVHSQ